MKITNSKVVVGEETVVSGLLFPLKHEMTYQGPYKPETVTVQIWARIDEIDGSHYLNLYDSYSDTVMDMKPVCRISGDHINLYLEAIARLSEEMKKPHSEEKG